MWDSSEIMYKYNMKSLCATSIANRCLLSVFCLFMLASFNVQVTTGQAAGANTYLTYCSGCHGKDGFAAYEHAPSFTWQHQGVILR